MALVTAVEVSYLEPSVQEMLYEYIQKMLLKQIRALVYAHIPPIEKLRWSN